MAMLTLAAVLPLLLGFGGGVSAGGVSGGGVSGGCVRSSVTAQEGTRILGKNRREIRKVWKELCHGKAETLEDAEETVKWWRYNIIR